MTEEQKTEGCSESACSSCSQAGSCSSKKVDLHEPANAHSSIGKVIGVVSGKGGVGKSLVTGSLARQMVKMGYKVGILDADITGLSAPLQKVLLSPESHMLSKRETLQDRLSSQYGMYLPLQDLSSVDLSPSLHTPRMHKMTSDQSQYKFSLSSHSSSPNVHHTNI